MTSSQTLSHIRSYLFDYFFWIIRAIKVSLEQRVGKSWQIFLSKLWDLWRNKRRLVVYYAATWYTFQRKLKKIKKVHPKKNSLYFKKWNFLTLRLKNFLYFLKRKLFLYFRKWNPAFSGLSSQNFSWKKFPKIKSSSENISYIFSK